MFTEEYNFIVQGITGKQGSFHTKQMLKYGTNIVAGVTPGKGGTYVENIKVYNSVLEALEEHEANWSIVFVPAKFAKEATIEALENGLNVIVITEGIPVRDALEMYYFAKEVDKILIGPNTPGFLIPPTVKAGIMPGHIFKEGSVSIVSRSGTLTYEVVSTITKAGFGERIAVGVGGDPIVGTSFSDVLEQFEKDKKTKAIVLIGEIGGNMEEEAAEIIKEYVSKPVFFFIGGKTAPPGKKMGHAGAIITGRKTAKDKVETLAKAGAINFNTFSELSELLKDHI